MSNNVSLENIRSMLIVYSCVLADGGGIDFNPIVLVNRPYSFVGPPIELVEVSVYPLPIVESLASEFDCAFHLATI